MKSLFPLAEQIVRTLARTGCTLTTAESCTGGLIAAAVTEVPGASAVLHCAWVTYCNAAKEKYLAVPAELIEHYTAVSEPVVRTMAVHARRMASADYALAVSGNAGPTAPVGDPPVGTVCLALATADAAYTCTVYRPELGRAEFRRMVVRAALNLLLQHLQPTARV